MELVRYGVLSAARTVSVERLPASATSGDTATATAAFAFCRLSEFFFRRQSHDL